MDESLMRSSSDVVLLANGEAIYGLIVVVIVIVSAIADAIGKKAKKSREADRPSFGERDGETRRPSPAPPPQIRQAGPALEARRESEPQSDMERLRNLLEVATGARQPPAPPQPARPAPTAGRPAARPGTVAPRATPPPLSEAPSRAPAASAASRARERAVSSERMREAEAVRQRVTEHVAPKRGQTVTEATLAKERRELEQLAEFRRRYRADEPEPARLAAASPRSQVAPLLAPSNIRNAFVVHEILGRPVSRRPRGRRAYR